MSNRDTQFQNFANIVYMECTNIAQEGMLSNRIDTNQRVVRHIARRAYDLVAHAIDSVRPMAFQHSLDTGDIIHDTEDVIGEIPDMTELPDEWVVSKVEAFRKLSSPGVTFSEGPEPPKEQEHG